MKKTLKRIFGRKNKETKVIKANLQNGDLLIITVPENMSMAEREHLITGIKELVMGRKQIMVLENKHNIQVIEMNNKEKKTEKQIVTEDTMNDAKKAIQDSRKDVVTDVHDKEEK